MTSIGTIAELRRYPVKSLAGERLDRAEVEARGLVGDRRWAVTDGDGKFGSGKNTRRFRKMDGLLDLSASYGAGSTPLIAFPDGRRISGDDPGVHDALSAQVGQPVRLLGEGAIPHFDEGPLHLVTTSAMAMLARHLHRPVSTARLRPNVLIDTGTDGGMVEFTWVGRTLTIGADAVIHVRGPMPRCVMVDLPQAELPPATGLLDAVGRLSDAQFGVVADVVAPGTICVDDAVELLAGNE